MSEFRERVQALVYGLGGETADNVAEYLRHRGIKGFRNEGDCCPVTNYLIAEIGDEVVEQVAIVSQFRILMYGDEDVLLPNSVSAFVRLFDVGEYPELEVGSD